MDKSNKPGNERPHHSGDKRDRKDRDRKDKEGFRRPSPFLFGLAALSIVALAYVLYLSANQISVPTSDLTRLIDVTRFEDGERENSEANLGQVSIFNRIQKKKVRYSELNIDTVSRQQITGSLTVEYAGEQDQWQNRRENIQFVANPPDGQEAYSQLLADLNDRGFRYNIVKPSVLELYGPYILWTLILIAILIFFYQKVLGGGGPMQFGRSRGRLYAHEDLGISFESVAGIDEAVDEVKEIVDFLSNAEKYQRLGGRIPKGVLLVGPPGTGKTLLAKAIAGEAGVPFFSLSGSDFVEMFVGVGAARVRDTFQQAVAKAPCIIFIDELDALGKSRGSGAVPSHDEREQTLNALLVEMDGFDSNSGVIVMAATNRPETLDAALLRPGRFDRQVLVDRPDIHGREMILKVHVKNVMLNDDVDLKRIASMTSGFVGADLANLVNEAALLAARNGKDSVTLDEFYEGIERVTAGLEKKKRVMNEDEKKRVAFHEAGHALVAYVLPNTDPVHKVSIIPRGVAALGYTMQRPDEDRYLMTRGELESQIKILLAGTLAEEEIYPDISTGAQNDLERATNIAYRMVTEFGMSRLGRVNYSGVTRSAFLPGSTSESGRVLSEDTSRKIDLEVKFIIDELMEETRQIISQRAEQLEAITDRLMEVESVGHDELKEMLGPRLVASSNSHTPKRPPRTATSSTEATEQEETQPQDEASGLRPPADGP